MLVQAVDASSLVDDIRLDKHMRLSIVSTEKVSDDHQHSTGDEDDSAPQALIEAAFESKLAIAVPGAKPNETTTVKAEGSIVEVEHEGVPVPGEGRGPAEPGQHTRRGSRTGAGAGARDRELAGRQGPIGHVVMACSWGCARGSFREHGRSLPRGAHRPRPGAPDHDPGPPAYSLKLQLKFLLHFAPRLGL
jgi:hypothetical protein